MLLFFENFIGNVAKGVFFNFLFEKALAITLGTQIFGTAVYYFNRDWQSRLAKTAI